MPSHVAVVLLAGMAERGFTTGPCHQSKWIGSRESQHQPHQFSVSSSVVVGRSEKKMESVIIWSNDEVQVFIIERWWWWWWGSSASWRAPSVMKKFSLLPDILEKRLINEAGLPETQGPKQ